MKVNPPLIQYLHEAKALEIIEELRAKGYQVVKDKKEGSFQFDIVATKGKEKVYIEIKTGSSIKKASPQLASMAHYVQSIPNARFEFVVANPPRKKEIAIEGLEEELFDYLINNFPSELDILSTHTRIKDVSNIDIDKITVEPDMISVSGSATVEVSLQYGSDREQEEGDIMNDSFPLKFEVVLDSDLKIQDVQQMDIDTSSWFE